MTALDDRPDIDWDALSQKERAALGVPSYCPSWCTNSHRQAVEEGCTPEEARVHVAGDYAGRTDVDGECHAWGVWLRADPGLQGGSGRPIIDLETRQHSSMVALGERPRSYTIRLDTGSARILARQLLHLADAGDLDISS